MKFKAIAAAGLIVYLMFRPDHDETYRAYFYPDINRLDQYSVSPEFSDEDEAWSWIEERRAGRWVGSYDFEIETIKDGKSFTHR